MERKATVVGGGIGGAAVAIGMVRAGWQVTVHERAPHRETSGAAIGIWPVALSALDELGLGEAVRAAATPQSSGAILRPDGRRIATISAVKLRKRFGESVHLVARNDLATILAEALPEDVLRYGSPVQVDEELPGDVVVVADGVFSAGRTALFGPRFAARYTGQTAFRGRVPITSDAVSETWGPGCRFGITPYRDGTTNWYASVSAPPHGRTAGEELALLRSTFAGWHPAVGRVLAAVTEEGISRHDLYDVHPKLASYVVGRAVLIGDAAHGMTPDLGRGACEALVDAAALARLLSSAHSTVDIAAALAGFDRLRRGPTQRLQAVSYRMGRLAHARRLTGLRNLAVRTALAV